MPLFIILNLALSFLQQSAGSYLNLVTADTTVYIGLGMIIVSLIIAFSKSIHYIIWHDLFASGVLLTWFADWHGQFQNDAPMFFYCPLCCCVFTVFISFFFIIKREKIAEETIRNIKFLPNIAKPHIAIIIAIVLFSLLQKSQFLLFPIAMTLFILKFALTACLQER